jgi:hypothetical protein
MNDISSEANASALPSFISTLTNMVKKYNGNHHSVQFNLFNKEMVYLKEKQNALQAISLDIEQKGDSNLKDVKVQLQELFDTLSNVIHHQNNKLLNLNQK